MGGLSVITPCYNAANFLGAAIRSVQEQTLPTSGHIIVNDGSADCSSEIVRELAAGDSRIALAEQENRGCAAARNAGFKVLSDPTQYVAFLDADDCWAPGFVEIMCNYLDENPKVGMVHCAAETIDQAGLSISGSAGGALWPKRYIPTRWGVRALRDHERRTPFVSIFALAGIVPSLCVFRREVYAATRGWDEDLRIGYEDVALYLQVALVSEVHFIPQKLVRYRRHPEQSTQRETAIYPAQERRMYESLERVVCGPSASFLISEGRWFRERRLGAIRGFQAAVRHARRAEWKAAVRFFGGAMRRYIPSLLRVPEFCQRGELDEEPCLAASRFRSDE